jgi:phosphatidylglycerophosphate synthase
MTSQAHEYKSNEALKGQDALAEVFLVDPITLPIAKFLAKLKVHPLVITFFALIFRLAGAVLFIVNLPDIGAISSIVGFYLDGIDGKIARIRHLDEELHGTMDFLLDQTAFGFLGVGALVWAINNHHNASAILIGCWLATYMILMAFTSTLYRILSQNGLINRLDLGQDLLKENIKANRIKSLTRLLLIFSKLFAKYNAVKAKMKRFRTIPYFGAIESEIVIFMIAPFFAFNPIVLLVSVIFLLPDTLITFTWAFLEVMQ